MTYIHMTNTYISHVQIQSRGERSGEGLMVLVNKDRFYGRWEGDLPHGRGTYWSRSDETTVTGTWARGVMVGFIPEE